MRGAILFFLAVPALAQPITFSGSICRMNRAADRMIVATDRGARVQVVASSPTVTFEGIQYDRQDLRTGDHVKIAGNRNGAQIRATAIDAHVRVADAVFDSLFPSHTIVGRFAVREAKTEFFSLNLPGHNYVRVDAKAAYGPNGRVRVSSLKSGDLLEIRGERPSKDILVASSINVITDKENATCMADARRNESKEATAGRESDEEKFLQSSNDER